MATSVATGTERCPWCTKRVYFAERSFHEGQYFHPICLREQTKKEAETKMTFSISEKMFTNPEGGVRNAEPVVQDVVLCGKCGHSNFGKGGFCIKCRAAI